MQPQDRRRDGRRGARRRSTSSRCRWPATVERRAGRDPAAHAVDRGALRARHRRARSTRRRQARVLAAFRALGEWYAELPPVLVPPATRGPTSPGRSCRACRRPRSARRPRRPRRAGSVAATGTLRSPEAKPGSTWRSTARAASALSSSGRARSVEPWMRPRLPISMRRSSSAFAPAPMPITHDPAADRERVEVAGQVRARRRARGSRRTGPSSSKPSGAIALHAERGDLLARVLVADRRGDARAGHRAELDGGHADAAGGAVDEQPLADASGRAWVKSASWAVVKTSGTPPAAVQSSSSGTGIACARGRRRARPGRRRPTIAITRSPGSKRSTPAAARRPPRPPAPGPGCPAARRAARDSARRAASCRRR